MKNDPENMNQIYETFRGVAWGNSKYFFKNWQVNTYGDGNGDISWDENRNLANGYKECPKEYL